MATNPRKPKDPTELALSAIEDALRVPNDTPPAPTPSTSATDRSTTSRRMPPAGSLGDRADAVRRTSSRAPQIEADDRPLGRGAAPQLDMLPPSSVAANENRESVGQLLRALQRRPRRTPY